MTANKKIVLLVILGAGACLLGFFMSQYFSKRAHDDQVLLVRIQSMAPRIEHIRMLSENFVREADAVHWQTMVRDMASLETDLLSGTRAKRPWAREFQELKTGVADYRKLLDQIHGPALRLKAAKTRLEGLGLSFSEEVRTRIIDPYRKEESLSLYQGRRVDPIKIRIKETAYNVMMLQLQRQLILMELLADRDLPGYRRKKDSIARTLEKHRMQLRYLGVLMGDDIGIGPVLASLGGQMDDLVGHETTIIETFEDLRRLNTALIAGGKHLLRSGETLTHKIVADIEAAGRLNRFLSWGG